LSDVEVHIVIQLRLAIVGDTLTNSVGSDPSIYGGNQSKNRNNNVTRKQNWTNIAMSTFRLE